MRTGAMRRAALAVLVLAPAAFGAVTLRAPVYELIAPGVAYARVEEDNPPLVFHVVKVDLRKRRSGATIGVEAIKSDGRQTVAQMADALVTRRRPLLVAINGDFFERDAGNALPWGIHVQGGELLFSPAGRSAFMVDAQGKPLIGAPALKIAARFPAAAGGVKTIAAVNRPRAADDAGLFLYTRAWGPAAPALPGGMAFTLSGGAIELGKTVKCTVEEVKSASIATPIPDGGMILTCDNRNIDPFRRLGLKSKIEIKGELTPPAVEAVGGGPRIVRAGKPSVETKEEAFPQSQAVVLDQQRHPRAAIGCNQQRTMLVLLIVEGRTQASDGVTVPDLAQLMILLGAHDAMNLDGGGSATLYVAGRMVTHGGSADAASQRQVGNAVGIFYYPKGKGA